MEDKVINADHVKQLALELETEIVKLENALIALKEDVVSLQKGDELGPYWNGENALKMNTALLGHIDHDFVLLENVKKCSSHISSLKKS